MGNLQNQPQIEDSCSVYPDFEKSPENSNPTVIWNHLSTCTVCRDRFLHSEGMARDILADLEYSRELNLLRGIFPTGGSEPPKTSLDESRGFSPTPRSQIIPVIPGFQILKQLGQGGSGEVWLATQEGMGRKVALKIMLKTTEEQKVRLQRECQILGSLSHPNLLPIYASGIHENRVWMALEYCPGGSLNFQIDQYSNPLKAAILVSKVAAAAHAVHEKGIVHRDIKPGNILIGADGEPKLADFDLARNTESGQESTRQTQILGTPAYIAPEQVRSKKVDARADVHALGGVLYHLLTGKAPFKADTPYEALLLAVHTNPVPPQALRPGLPRDIDQICRKCLAKDPVDRYPSAAEMAADLCRFLDNQPVKARPLSPPKVAWRWAQRNPIGAGSILVAALALMSITALSAKVAYQASDFAKKTGTLNQNLENANKEITQKEKEARDQEDLAKKEAERAQIGEKITLEEVYRNRLTQAQNLFERWDPRPAIDQLEQCSFSQRGWEHDFLYSRLTENQIDLTSSGPPIVKVFFKDQGKTLVSLTKNGVITAFSTKTLLQKHQINTLVDGQISACLSHDGILIACGNQNGYFQVWNLHDNIKIDEFYNQDNSINNLIFSNDNKNVLFIDSKGKLIVRDLTNHTVSHQKTISQEALVGLSMSPDGTRIAICSIDKSLIILGWPGLETQSATKFSVIPHHPVFSPDGTTVTTGNADNVESLTQWKVDGLESIWHGFGHKDGASGICHSPDNAFIASAGNDRSIQIWDQRNGKNLRKLVGHPGAVQTLDIHPDGFLIASGDDTGVLKLWTINPISNPFFINRESGNRPLTLIEDIKGKQIICGTSKGDLKFFDNDSFRLKKVINATQDEILSFCLDKNNNSIYFGTNKGEIYNLSFKNYKINLIHKSSNEKIFDIKLHRDNYLVFLSMGHTGEYYLVNNNKNKRNLLLILKTTERPKFLLSYSENSPSLLTHGKKLIIFNSNDLMNFTEKSIIEDEILNIAFNNLSNTVILICKNKIIELDNKNYKPIQGKFEESYSFQHNLDISKNGKFMATRDGGWGIQFWDLESGKKLLSFVDNGDEITNILFLNDRKTMVTTSLDRSTRLYRPNKRSHRAKVPIYDILRSNGDTSNEKPLAQGQPKVSLSLDGNLIIIAADKTKTVEATTFQLKNYKNIKFPEIPIFENSQFRLEWDKSSLFLIDKLIERENSCQNKLIAKQSESIDFKINSFLFFKNIINKDLGYDFIIYHLKRFYNLLVLSFDNLLPKFANESVFNLLIGESVSFPILSSNTPTSTCLITSGSLPSGLTLDSSTGLIQGTLSQGEKGKYKIQITASNLAGSVSQKFHFEVFDPILPNQRPGQGIGLAIGSGKDNFNGFSFAAIKKDGSVVSWGRFNPGPETGITYADGQILPIVQIFSNWNCFAALTKEGSVRAWGNKIYGGDTSSVSEHINSGVFDIVSNDGSFSALKNDGSVISWGNKQTGAFVPGQINELKSGVKSIFSNQGSFAAIKSNGSVFAWGDSDTGGNSSVVANRLDYGVVNIFSSYRAFAALKSNGSVVTWGDSKFGGNSTLVADQLQSGVVKIYSTLNAFAALKYNGAVVIWGTPVSDWPRDCPELQSGVTDVFSNNIGFVFQKTDGSIVNMINWKEIPNSFFPNPDLVRDVQSVSSTHRAFAAIKKNGNVVTWGSGPHGADSSSVIDNLQSGVVAIYSTSAAFAALKNDGSVVTWGDPGFGGNSLSVAPFIQKGVRQIFSNHHSFAALKEDGSVVTWGNPECGGDSSAIAKDIKSGIVAFACPTVQSPWFISAESATFQLGKEGQFQIQARGIPMNITFGISQGKLPEGLRLNPFTGIISGIPKPGTQGIYQLMLSASNGPGKIGNGTISYQNFQLIVK